MPYAIQDLLLFWDRAGVFDFIFPFFLVFAIVYGVLQYLRLFKDQKAVHIIISVVIGIMAARYPYFTQFYQELFPRLGVGVVVLLALLILMGLFFTERQTKIWMGILLAIGAVIGIIILFNTFSVLGWLGGFGYAGSDVATWIITAVLLIGVIVVIAVGSSPPDNEPDHPRSPWDPRTHDR